jgi:quercetin dioxygenase-like cupin family protein
MIVSRRELALFFPLAAGEQKNSSEAGPVLEGKIYQTEALPWRANASGASKSRAIFNGFTTRGQHLTMHMTELAPGQQPHPAARQPHEEILIVREGTIECTINGETAKLHPGDIVYSAYNDLKDWKNVGSQPAVYFVISLEEHH